MIRVGCLVAFVCLVNWKRSSNKCRMSPLPHSPPKKHNIFAHKFLCFLCHFHLSMPPGSFIGPCKWKNWKKPMEKLFSWGHNLIICDIFLDFVCVQFDYMWCFLDFVCVQLNLWGWWSLWQFFNNDLSNRSLLSSNGVFHHVKMSVSIFLVF
jgi:hypothetical protein